MNGSAELFLSNLLNINKLDTRASINTQYVVMVVKVSEDGRFVSVVDCTLEWKANPNGDTFMLNSYNKSIRCSKIKPWVINDVPVEQPYVRGQWKINTRPRVGDYGILSVFYHDIDSWKQKGGFQAPSAIRIHALDSCSFRPGLPNHADVDAEQEAYPSDDEWEIKGNGVNIKFTSPVDENSESPNKMQVNVGTVSFTIEVPKDGNPTVVLNIPDGSMTVNVPTSTINSDVTINGTLTTSSTIQSGADITSGGDVITAAGNTLDTHVHQVTGAAALVPPPAPTPPTTPPVPL